MFYDRAKNFALKFLLGLSSFIANCLYVSTPGYAEPEYFNPPSVRIIWKKTEGRSDSDAGQKKSGDKLWIKACKNIAKSVLIGKGPWGVGIFKRSSCYVDTKKLIGKESSRDWLLYYREGENETTLELFSGPDDGSLSLAKATFPGDKKSMAYFQEQAFVDLISLRLLNQLPVMGWLKKGALGAALQIRTRPIYIPQSGVRLYKVVSPPKSLKAFQASGSPVFLSPEIKGEGSLVASFEPIFEDPDSGRSASERMTKKNVKDFYVIWKFDQGAADANKSDGLWIQDSRGANLLAAELDASIAGAAKALSTAIEEGFFNKFLKGLRYTTPAGYLGVRYGVQMLSGDPLLKKAAFFGLISEIRGGPLTGLRYYWDKVPQVKHETNGLRTELEWSRHIIGRSFGLDLKKLVDRIDVVPKIGIWSFNARLVDSINSDGTPATTGKFQMARSFSLGIEAGLEWLSDWYTIRPWYSYDYANGKNAASQKMVTSNRIGFDTYLTGGPKFGVFGLSLRTTVMGFFIYERISLSTTTTTPNDDDGDDEIIGVTFSSGYTGIGIAVSW